jgi:hypothetical protein
VNLAPLAHGGRFNEAKSAIKWLEAALVATPTIATPTQPFREAIEPGLTGLLATTHDEWVEELSNLVGDTAGQHRIGQTARREALVRWSPERQADRYLQILETARDAVAAHGHRTGSTWEDEVLDEPYHEAVLELYELPVTMFGTGGPRPVARAMTEYYERARLLLRQEGPGAVARKAGRVSLGVPKRIARRAMRSR